LCLAAAFRVPELAMSANPLVALIQSQPGMAQRLLSEHGDDGSGRCRVCSTGGQTGRYRWPCALRRYAEQADTLASDGLEVGFGASPADTDRLASD
jgi:hypothetical protein